MKTPKLNLGSVAKLNHLLGLQSGDVLQRPHLMELAKTHPNAKVKKLATSVLKIKGWDKMNPIVKAS